MSPLKKLKKEERESSGRTITRKDGDKSERSVGEDIREIWRESNERSKCEIWNRIKFTVKNDKDRSERGRRDIAKDIE